MRHSHVRRRWFLVLGLLAPLAAPAMAVEWRRDFAQGLEEARERGAPIFVLFAQTRCPPAKAMYEQVLKADKDFDAACENAVPILCHCDETPANWRKGIAAYLVQRFYTPAYVFADSRGRPLDDAFTTRTMHQMVKAKDLAAKLAGYSRAAKPISYEVWQDARGRLLDARKALEQGDAAGAVKLLDGLLATECGPYLTARARRLKQEAADHPFWQAEAKRLKDAPADDREAEECRSAVKKALAGDPVSAAEDLATFLSGAKPGEYGKAAVLQKRCAEAYEDALTDAFEAVHIRTMLLGVEHPVQAGDAPQTRRPYGAYWMIGVSLGSDLTSTAELTVQYYVRASDGNVHAGFQTFRNVPRGGGHQTAACLPMYLLASRKSPKDAASIADIQDIRFEVYAGGRLVASRQSPDRKAASQSRPAEPRSQDWWHQAEYRPLAFLEKMSYWETGTLGPAVRQGLVFGSEAKAAAVDAEPPPSLHAEVLTWMYGQGIMNEFGRPEERPLLAMGDLAVGSLARAAGTGKPGTLRYAAVLARLRAKEGIAPLVESLKSNQPYTALYCLQALSQYGDDRSIPPEAVTPLLDDANAQVRLSAAYVLGVARDEKAASALIARLKKEPAAEVRAQLVGALARTTGQDFGLVADRPLGEQAAAVRRLDAWWSAHRNEKREVWASDALAAAGYSVGKPSDWPQGRLPEAAEDAVGKAALDKHWPTAYAALRLPAAGNGKVRVPTLLDALRKAPCDEVREAALLGLRETVDRDSLGRLLEIAQAQPALAEHIVPLLEDVTGEFSLSDSDDTAKCLEAWRMWVFANGPYLYRPEGWRRFLLAEMAKLDRTAVDPITGKPKP